MLGLILFLIPTQAMALLSPSTHFLFLTYPSLSLLGKLAHGKHRTSSPFVSATPNLLTQNPYQKAAGAAMSKEKKKPRSNSRKANFTCPIMESVMEGTWGMLTVHPSLP